MLASYDLSSSEGVSEGVLWTFGENLVRGLFGADPETLPVAIGTPDKIRRIFILLNTQDNRVNVYTSVFFIFWIL